MARNGDGQPYSFLFLNHDLEVVVVVVLSINTDTTFPSIVGIVVCALFFFVLFLNPSHRRKWFSCLVLPFPQQVFLFPRAQFVFAAVLVALRRSGQHHIHYADQHDGFDGNVQGILRDQIPPPGLVQTRKSHHATNTGLDRIRNESIIGQHCDYRCGVDVVRVHFRRGVVQKPRDGLAGLEAQLVDGREEHRSILCYRIGMIVFNLE
mmetsp:Transcript_60394/g.123208  ORF Transcript_60394/g.123208 Transcript_60394/m.123208 type:complete len:207 (-) Transcript_60394:44-664(-)